MVGFRRDMNIVVPFRTILVLAAVFFVGWAIVSIRETLILIFTGIFLGLVFEYPVRALEHRLHLRRSLAAPIVVLGTTVVVTLLALWLLVPLVESVRDFLKALPDLVQHLRDEGVLSGAGDTGAAQHVQQGADDLASAIPDAVSSILGVANQAFAVFISAFTLIFLCLFFLTDVGSMKRAAAGLLMPGDADRWLGVWERITATVSRWAIGVVIVAAIAGTVQGLTAFLLGSSYALALGIIAGALDVIPNIGATIAGFILVPTLLAEQGVTAAIIMLVVILVYQQVENNLVTPAVQGKATRISAFFVILGVTVFGALLGVLGALVAVPVTATIQIVLAEVSRARREDVARVEAESTAEAPA